MEKIKVQDAIGKPLLHDITEVCDNFKGARFKRGHVIQKEDIEVLLRLGKKDVFVENELSKDEIHEEDAAKRLSAICTSKHAHHTPISEGKTVLIADEKGFWCVNTSLLNQINSIGDITISTLKNHYRAEKGARLASMRIVPLVCKKEEIEKAESISKGKTLVELKPYSHKKVGVIITGSEVYSGKIQDKFEATIRRKLEYYPHEVVGVIICDDDVNMIKEAATTLTKKGANVLIFTGGMSVDPDDVTPVAIRELEAEVITHGVPAQPGNMTILAYKDDVPYIGVPSAAISVPTTVLDTLLPAIFADYKISKQELVNLGNGGLCQFCEPCHFPNCQFGEW